jgi:hypothetical protein
VTAELDAMALGESPSVEDAQQDQSFDSGGQEIEADDEENSDVPGMLNPAVVISPTEESRPAEWANTGDDDNHEGWSRPVSRSARRRQARKNRHGSDIDSVASSSPAMSIAGSTRPSASNSPSAPMRRAPNFRSSRQSSVGGHGPTHDSHLQSPVIPWIESGREFPDLAVPRHGYVDVLAPSAKSLRSTSATSSRGSTRSKRTSPAEE